MASKSKTQPKQKRSAYVVGAVVATALALLTIGEYILALVNPSPTYLFLIAFLKAILVVYFFMHVYRLWRTDEHASDGGH